MPLLCTWCLKQAPLTAFSLKAQYNGETKPVSWVPRWLCAACVSGPLFRWFEKRGAAKPC